MLSRTLITQRIQAYCDQQGWDVSDWIVEIPKDTSHGDYATNIAFLLARQLKKSPVQIAEDISTTIKDWFTDEELQNTQIEAIKGFVNFRLPVTYYYQSLTQSDFARDVIEDKQRLLIEFVSANPTGPLHIGHGRWAAVGDSLRRICERAGYQVSTEFYINDAGRQVELLKRSVEEIKAGQPVSEEGYQGQYIKELVDATDPLQEILGWQRKTLLMFRVKFDNWFSERERLHDTGSVKQTIEELKKKKLTYTQEGALFFRSTDFGDDKDRVLIKDNGDYTYFAADIAYHINKASRGYDRLINIWGADHHGYIKRVKAGIESLTGKKDLLEVLLGQLVTLYRDGEEVRMSKRTGEMITLQEVMDEIGVDATRFYLNLKSIDTHLDFDLDLARKQSNDNPVFYVQYAHARIQSILRKSSHKPCFHDSVHLTDVETNLIRFLHRFEDEVYLSALKREPHRIAQYLIECATQFHSFYHRCKVNVSNKQVSQTRLALISQVKRVLAEGLDVLGIEAPDKM